MLNNDITDTGVDEQYFVVNWESLGVHHEVNLCPDGDKIKLSELNKSEYVANYLKWRFTRGTSEQYSAFSEGIDELVPLKLLRRRFDERELDLVVSGLGLMVNHSITKTVFILARHNLHFNFREVRTGYSPKRH